jgi:hypothetical protein
MMFFRSLKLAGGTRTATRTVGIIKGRFLVSASYGDEAWYSTLDGGDRQTIWFGLVRRTGRGAHTCTLVLWRLAFLLGWTDKRK